MALRRAVFALVTVLVAGGCFSLDGFSGGVPQPDGGQPQPDATTSVDGGDSDVVVTTPPDGGDASADAAAGPNPACATAFFCDDFERTTLLGGWSQQLVDGASSLGLTTATAERGSSSMHVSLGTSGNSFAWLKEPLTKFSVLDVSFAFYRESETDNTDLGAVNWGGGGAFTKIFGHLGKTSLAFAEQQFTGGSETAFNQTPYFPVPAQTWVTITLHIDFAAKKYSATLAGTPVASNVAMTATYPDTLPEFEGGTDYSSSATPVGYDIDDVVIQLTP